MAKTKTTEPESTTPEQEATLQKLVRELDVHIRARYPLISVNTFEEGRFTRAVTAVADLEKHKDKSLYTWSRVAGLRQYKEKGRPQSTKLPDKQSVPFRVIPEKEDSQSILEYISGQDEGLFILCDFGPHLSPYGQPDPIHVRMLRELAWKIKSRKITVLFVDPAFPDIPALQKEIKRIDLSMPCEREVAAMFDSQLARLADNEAVRDNIHVDAQTREQIVQALLGLTEIEIEIALAKTIIMLQGMTAEALPVILDEKRNIIRGTGTVTYSHPEPLSHLGGYQNLRHLLTEAAVTFTPAARARNVDPMKGMLLVGLPGNGKDLAMQVASSIIGRPLLKLDMAAVMGEGGGVIGSGAMTIKRALTIAETVKGILGISEFEKGVGGLASSNKTDGGETARTIGFLLDWMQQQRSVFAFATANDVRDLAGEQIRQGRFSYIAFVDNPRPRSRMEIAAVHLRRRDRDPEKFNLDEIAEKTEGFNGAEIEAAVSRGILTAFMDGDRETTTRDILRRAENITPLSVMKREQMEEIRRWAKEHMAVDADGEDGAAVAAAPTERAIEI